MRRHAEPEVVYRSLDGWSGPRTRSPQRSRFDASWEKTWSLLMREASSLGARRLLILLDADATHFRLDGRLRAEAKLRSQAVVVVVDGRHGPIRLPCDRYDRWQDNIRAIALSLEALRSVDRYGVTRSSEQYRGWTALPPGSAPEAADPWRTVEEAAAFLIEVLNGTPPIDGDELALLEDPNYLASLWRDIVKKCHPDQGGDAKVMVRANRAKAFIDRSREAMAGGAR